MIKTTQYKNTSIGPIPTEWEVKKLGEICEFKNGYAFKSNLFKNEGLPIIRITNINSSRINMDDVKYFNISDYKSLRLDDFVVKKGDVLIALSGATTGKSGYYDLEKESYLNQRVGKFIPNKGILENLFLYQYLISKNDFLYELAGGGAQPNLSSNILKEKLIFPLPPLPEQQKIAEVLSTWDKAIQETDAIIKKLQDRNKALAFSLLRGKLVNKNSKKISLSKFLTFTPREIEKPTENYLALGIRSHGKGIFHKPDSDPKAIAMDKLYEVKENDFIVNITFAWEHAVAIISKEDEGGLVSHRFPTYVIDQKTVSVEFFRHIILQPFFKQMLDNISPGGAGRNRVLSKKDLLKLEISVPSLEEQTVIAEVLNTAQQELKQYEEKLKALQQQKKGLMQQLLTGKVRTV